MKIKKLNIKNGFPACDEALSLVLTEIETLKMTEIQVIKIIHGYGSNGTGGKIKKELKYMLENLKKHKIIEDFFQNEKFEFNDNYKFWTQKFPELIFDNDLKNQNPGITLVFLKKNF